MKILFWIMCLLLTFFQAFGQELEGISAIEADTSNYEYEESIEAYKTAEMWTIWTSPFSNGSASSRLKSQKSNSYSVDKLSDFDLNTAWIEGKSDYGIGEQIEFVFEYPKHAYFGSAYQFYGRVNLFNGYCKSMKTWEENSRVKTLKVYFNDTPIALVELVDTWQFQYFDFSHFFRNHYINENLNAPYEVKEGDKLMFEIVDVYKGSKYSDVGFSEFMYRGASN